jgi:hypothetical protein
MGHEILPDLTTCCHSKVRVGEEQVNTRLEGVIDGGETVSSEEKNSLVVFEFGEED